MKPPIKPPEKLLGQLVENSAGLVRAEARLRAATEHRDELARNFDKQMAFTRRMERLILLLLLICLLAFGFILYQLFPHWLPQHWAAFTPSIKQP